MVHTRRALELDPRFARGYNDLAIVYRLMGKETETVENALRRDELNGVDPARTAKLREAFHRSGLKGYDRMLLDLALAGRPTAFVLAGLYKNLGDYGRAMDFLEKSYDEHPNNMMFLRTFPGWKPMQKDPRYWKLLKRVGLDPPRLV